MTEMVSFGAGVNSTAMVVMLVNDGWRGPIVFADTSAEWPETYCWMRTFEDQWLKPRGLEITRLSPGSEWHQAERNCSLEDYCKRWGIIPLLATRWCSVRWKREPLNAWGEAHGYTVRLLGFSGEEHRRIKDAPDERYPLYEAGVSRRECQHIIERQGLPIPFKSGCFFCPGQALADWRRLYTEHPELYARAAQLEDIASEKHNKKATLDPHGISLREHAERRWEGQMTMDLTQWLPCLCSL
ncbi:MAG TPA: hypothetical protein VM537_30275 [Anaerolineae bacterium]|nr:hypothetical protein [Anaerolineae bacterium]